MTSEDALRLLDYTRTADVDARTHQIANGEWVVRICKKDYWLWNFEDWTAYAHNLKAERKAQRREAAMRAIDTTEVFALAL